jgi:Mitochondrial carrier protein
MKALSYSRSFECIKVGDDVDEEPMLMESLPTTFCLPLSIDTIRGDTSFPSSIPSVPFMLMLLLPVFILFSGDTSNAAVTTVATIVPPLDWSAIVQKAANKALGGGTAGASAAVVQVCTLMWLRTCMNYQYRYGGTLLTSLQTLWQQGGIPRLYQGLPFALVQGPLTRFGDTAANVGVLSLLEALPETRDWPLPLKTLCGSLMAGLWRILLMPIDASKTALQVQGAAGLPALWSQAAEQGPGVLYRGAFAQAAATAVGHFPWFLTYNFFNDLLPVPTGEDAVLLSLARSAALGFFASTVSDCCSNSLRVIKTTKQTAQLSRDSGSNSQQRDLSYPEVVRMIVDQDGLAGLFGRGLQTRLLTNAIQGAMFSILWKYFQQQASGS